jgi:5-methylcytosine-specific restriction enzyme subunit McrC
MPDVLRLREFERITCGSIWDAESRVVALAQQRQLERFSESFRRTKGVPAFANGPRGTLVAQNFVGVVCLGRYQVEVLPKVEGPDHSVRSNLMRMVAATLNLTLNAETIGQIERTDESVLEVMIRLFCAELWTAVRRGLVRHYETREDNLVVMRGRLKVASQLRHNLARPDRLYCTFDEFSEDNGLNRVLKAAIRLLLGASRSPSSTRSLSELLFCFQDVTDLLPSAALQERVVLSRLSDRYRPLVELAQLFLRGYSPDVVAGDGHGFAVLFDMNELFEEYVGRQTRAALKPLGFDVTLQGPKRHLACTLDDTPTFQLRPDIVVARNGHVNLIIDTKWKRLKEDQLREGVASADAYQMFAYAERFDTDDVVLLYPHHSGLGTWKPQRATYKLGGIEGFGRRRVAVSTVDLSDLKSVRNKIIDVAEACLAHAA